MTALPAPEQVRLALERRFRGATAGGPGSALVTDYPEIAAAVAMAVVGPVLEARDAEIVRLREISEGRKKE